MKKRDRVFDTNVLIYVLSLEDGYFYVGQTANLNRRIEQHIQKRSGASFTKLYSVISLVETYQTDTQKLIEGEIYEDFFVMKYIAAYGAEKVKGGKFLTSVKKRESKFNFYKTLFDQACETSDPPKTFFCEVSRFLKTVAPRY